MKLLSEHTYEIKVLRKKKFQQKIYFVNLYCRISFAKFFSNEFFCQKTFLEN